MPFNLHQSSHAGTNNAHSSWVACDILPRHESNSPLGISQSCTMRSKFNSFTEIRNSQCIPHVALHFIPQKRDSAHACSTQRLINGKQECHPYCCSVPRSIHSTPHWKCSFTLHAKALSPTCQIEQIPIHSQLLHKYILV